MLMAEVNNSDFESEKKKLLDEYRVNQYREQMGDEWVRVIKDTDLARAEYKITMLRRNGCAGHDKVAAAEAAQHALALQRTQTAVRIHEGQAFGFQSVCDSHDAVGVRFEHGAIFVLQTQR